MKEYPMDANTPDSTNKLELKNTVHLPKTDFPMKANLGNLETRLLAHWQETNIYERTREARKGRNPQTGKVINIKAKKVAKFKAGAELAKKVNK